MTTPNPTGDDSGVSKPDPVDRIEAFLVAQDDNGTQDDGNDDQPAQDAASTPDKPEGGDQGEDKGPQFTTAQLAQLLGIDESVIDVDEAGKPVFKTKVDGKEATAKLPDFLKDYQLRGHAENRVRELSERERAIQARELEAQQAIQAKAQAYDQRLEDAAALANVYEKELQEEFQSYNWDELWRSDAATARALERRFQERHARLQATKEDIKAKRAQNWTESSQQMQARARQVQQHEQARVMELIPEWGDNTVRQTELPQMIQWALQSGYDQNYLQALNEGVVPNTAVIVRDMRRAWKHETLQKAKPEVENRLRLAPKLVKPSTPPANDGGDSARIKSLKQQVKQSGGNSTKAAAEWLLATGKA